MFLPVHQVQCDVQNPVLLTGDGLAPSQLHDDVERVDVVLFAESFCVQKERGVHACIADGDRVAVGDRLKRHHRRDDEFGGVQQAEDVPWVLVAEFVECGRDQFGRSVARPRPQAAILATFFRGHGFANRLSRDWRLLKEEETPLVAIQVTNRNAPAVKASIKSEPKL